MASTRAARSVEDEILKQAVRESRPFYRRTLAQDLAKTLVRSMVARERVIDPEQVTEDATTIARLMTARLQVVEEQELLMGGEDGAKH